MGWFGHQPIILAVASLFVMAVQIVFQSPAASEEDKYMAMLQAAEKGDLKKVQGLIDDKVDIDFAGFLGKTPLMLAAARRDKKLAALLLQDGADPNTRDWSGETALKAAAEVGDIAIVRLLLDKGADVNATGNPGRTPLAYAKDRGHNDVAELLKKHGAKQEAVSEISELSKAARACNLEKAQQLVAAGAMVEEKDADGATALHWIAVSQEKSEFCRQLASFVLAKGAPIDSRTRDGRTPLMVASWMGHQDVAQLLLQRGANVSAVDLQGRTPLLFAALGRTDKILVQSGDRFRRQEGLNEGLVEMLLRHGAEINARDRKGDTALMYAARYGSVEQVKFWLTKGANRRIRNNKGQTALDIVILRSSPHLLEVLTSYVPDNIQDLIDSCRLQDPETVETLLANQGASVNSVGPSGYTPLMSASAWGNQPVVRMLLRKGAQVDLKDDSGCTALGYARKQGRKKIEKLLVRHGATE